MKLNTDGVEKQLVLRSEVSTASHTFLLNTSTQTVSYRLVYLGAGIKKESEEYTADANTEHIAVP